jgi:hypothetical protein
MIQAYTLQLTRLSILTMATGGISFALGLVWNICLLRQRSSNEV